ncbi:FkbM family methyltransferase [Chryseolinea lacunae]|uniref:FkbM family methyltransferase n=1 Tax=Chryseolinea lacunae TaxID=2801331 RepID=A0ABS1KSP6_9BACT|nr:FkbM family methyltransferase [Chryseolinea lacunae]MBL0742451.1 FkbM family methyltransferase [Chryseolinea lacunae]
MLKLLPRYILNLGLIEGTRAFLQVEAWKTSQVKMKGYDHPITIRKHTSDIKVFREVFLFHEYNFSMPVEPRVIIDAGANIGLAAVYFRKRFPAASIYAIEPDGGNFQVLAQHVAPLQNVVPIHSGLWHRDAFLRVRNESADAWAFEVEECGEQDAGAFKAVSVCGLMKRYGIEKIDFLKIDIEGSERELFMDGYDQWLPKTKVIIVELHDWIKEGCSRSVFKAIANYRFKTIVHGAMLLFINLDLD